MPLKIVKTKQYDLIWTDRGSGAPRDVSFWMPKPQEDLFPVGSIIVKSYGDIRDKYESILVGEGTPGDGTVVRPFGFSQVWSSGGTTSRRAGSIWRPAPPNGYRALGDVVCAGFDEPELTSIWCVRNDLVEDCVYARKSCWDHQKPGEGSAVSLWGIRRAGKNDGLLYSFWTSGNRYDPEVKYGKGCVLKKLDC